MYPTEVIRIEKLNKEFYTRKEKVVAIKDLDLSVSEGEFLCILGPSGCGKTTLLRILAGLEKQTKGKVFMRSKNPEKPLTSMVFQGDSVFPWMTVAENVAYSLRIRGFPSDKRLNIVEHYLKLMGLDKFANAFPYQLSGGMKQRINVARAFVSDPEILLMDEPFGALDEQNRLILQQELLKIWDGLLLADRIMVMTAHPGKVKAIVPVDIPRPRDILSLRSSPRFATLFREIWQLLQEEVLKAKTTEFKA